MSSTAHPSQSDKIVWLSIIQGWAILLVVIGHVNGYNYDSPSGDFYPLTACIHSIVYSFHMPLFMFVSGGLLYLTRLERGWKISALYIDKAKRLLLPYVTFTIIGFLIKAPLSHISKRGMEVSFASFMNAFFDPSNGPLNELWFVGTLMWLMFMYPLYKVMLRSVWTEILLLGISLLPFIIELHPDIEGWFALKRVPYYAFYFIAGILFFKYKCPQYLARHFYVTLILTALFIVCAATKFDGQPIVASLAIAASFGWGMQLQRFPRLFSSFRDHSFQIFLVGIFPQMFVEIFVWRKFYSPEMQIPFYLLSCFLALAAGVIMSKLAARIPIRWIRWCFGLK